MAETFGMKVYLELVVKNLKDVQKQINDSLKKTELKGSVLDRARSISSAVQKGGNIGKEMGEAMKMGKVLGGLTIIGGTLMAMFKVSKMMLDQMIKSSPYLRGVLNIFDRAMMYFFKPFGDFLASLLRPMAVMVLKMAAAWLKWSKTPAGQAVTGAGLGALAGAGAGIVAAILAALQDGNFEGILGKMFGSALSLALKGAAIGVGIYFANDALKAFQDKRYYDAIASAVVAGGAGLFIFNPAAGGLVMAIGFLLKWDSVKVGLATMTALFLAFSQYAVDIFDGIGTALKGVFTLNVDKIKEGMTIIKGTFSEGFGTKFMDAMKKVGPAFGLSEYGDVIKTGAEQANQATQTLNDSIDNTKSAVQGVGNQAVNSAGVYVNAENAKKSASDQTTASLNQQAQAARNAAAAAANAASASANSGLPAGMSYGSKNSNGSYGLGTINGVSWVSSKTAPGNYTLASGGSITVVGSSKKQIGANFIDQEGLHYLHRGEKVVNAERTAREQNQGMGGHTFNNNITINVQGNKMDPAQMARDLVRAMELDLRRRNIA